MYVTVYYIVDVVRVVHWNKIYHTRFFLQSFTLVTIALGALIEDLVAVAITADQEHKKEASKSIMSIFKRKSDGNNYSNGGSANTEDTTLENQAEEEKEARMSRLVACLSMLVFIALGGFFLGWVNGWDIIDTVYYTTITITTVGYVSRCHTYCTLQFVKHL